MSAPLISDATLATIFRALYSCPSCENWEGTQTVLWLVSRERYADALDHARGASHDPKAIAGVLEALEEANEEAASTFDEARVPGTYLERDLVVGKWTATIAGRTYSGATPAEMQAKIERGDTEPAPPPEHLDAAPESPKRQEHDPDRVWPCPKCTSTIAVWRIAEILAARGERYTHVIRCLCGEVRP